MLQDGNQNQNEVNELIKKAEVQFLKIPTLNKNRNYLVYVKRWENAKRTSIPIHILPSPRLFCLPKTCFQILSILQE